MTTHVTAFLGRKQTLLYRNRFIIILRTMTKTTKPKDCSLSLRPMWELIHQKLAKRCQLSVTSLTSEQKVKKQLHLQL